MPIRPSFVIGNGESRQSIDLQACKKLGLTVGCNAIVRDFHPHIISAADQRMVEQIQKTDYVGKLYTRSDWNEKYMIEPYPELPYKGDKREDNPWHWNSGPHALNLTCISRHSGWFGKKTNICFLLGFDLTQNNQPNNVYKNTEGYDNKVIDSKYWHHQLGKCFEHYKNIMFVWIAPSSYTCPEFWSGLDNFTRETIENFSLFINDYASNNRIVDEFL